MMTIFLASLTGIPPLGIWIAKFTAFRALLDGAGRVTVTLDASGERFDWSELIGSLFEVRWSASPPANAFVRVPYRGHWFYIADDDLDAKTTFSLLTYLFALQSSSPGGRSPLLTVSSGGG
jgi:hypothetical protein